MTTPPTAFITGFPGFLGKRLLLRLAADHPELHFVLLVEDRLVAVAEDTLEALQRARPALDGRWSLAVGDITQPLLGLPRAEYDALAARLTHIWHLAAIYNLAVADEVAHRVNVHGTCNVLDLAEASPHLQRLLYISTCYVSGQRTGRIREGELDEGQGFKNHYESTKFLAEVEVQRRRRRIPTVIFRPGIVVGDSRTGETDKYDGPYYIMKLLDRLPSALPMLNAGEGASFVNIVPVDFAIDAMVTLAEHPEAAGQVFHIADPHPMRAADVLDLMLEIMGRPPAVAALPSLVVEAALRSRAVRRSLGVPREVITYFNHDARYDTAQTEALLEGSGVDCPHLSTYLDVLIDYMRRHPKKSFLDGREV